MARNQKSASPAGQPAPPPDLDIDLGAALPAGPAPKRPRGRPRSAAPKPPRKYKVRKDKGIKRKVEPTYIDNTYISNIRGCSDIDINKGELSAAVSDLKSKMTVKELKFLEIYLGGNITQVNALKAAGYEDYNERYLETLARKIIVKHESQAGDHRIIFRAMGAGEVAVVAGLLKLAQGSKSDMVRLNAWSMIAKCIGLTKEQIEGQTGITIIFEGTAPQGQPAALALPIEQPTYQAPVRVLQITK